MTTLNSSKRASAGTPLVGISAPVEIFSGVLTADWQASDVEKIWGFRQVGVRLRIDYGNAANAVTVVPYVSMGDAEGKAPVAGSDLWERLPDSSEAPTNEALSGTLVSGNPLTVDQEFAVVTVRPLAIRMAPGSADSEGGQGFKLDIGGWSYFHLQFADLGTSTLATVDSAKIVGII